MSVEITGGQHLGGMPAFDHKININCVTIGLSKEDFAELVLKLDERISSDYQKAQELYNRWNKNLDTARAFKKELIDVFWIVEDESDWLLKRSEKDIDSEKLSEVLEKYGSFLGLG